MKNKLHQILFVTGFALIMPLSIMSAYGQDGAGIPNFDTDDHEIERVTDKIINSPGESTDPILTNTNKAASQPTVTKDTVRVSAPARTIKPSSAPKSTNKPRGDEDDSILSFNFLYYIIQKYKLQDIVD